MKTIKFFALATAVLAMGLTSCAKDGGETPSVEEHSANITIGVQPAQTRAVGEITGDTDNKINNFVALAFKANGQLDGEIIESPNGLVAISNGNITTATTEIYVIANAPRTLVDGITTKPELMTVVGNLNNAGLSSQTSAAGGNVWASGVSGVTFNKNITTNVYETAAVVSIKFVAARINVTVDNQMTNQGAVDAFTVTNIALLNATGSTKFFDESLIPSAKSYYAGIDMTYLGNIPNEYSVWSVLNDTYTAGTSNHFYVFENDATDSPTILTLIASYGNGISYCPLQFDLADAGKTIVRGNSYNVTLKLTGSADPNDNEDPGTVDPTLPVVKGNIEVTVVVESWIPNVIAKEF